MAGIGTLMQTGGGIIGSIFGKLGGQKGKGFRDTLKHKDFNTGDLVLVSNTAFNEVGTYQIPAQQTITYGQGPLGQPAVNGTVYLQSKDTTGTEFEGVWRIAVRNANGTNEDVLLEEASQKTDISITDKTTAIVVPEVLSYPNLTRIPSRDDKFVLYMKPDTAGKELDYGLSTVFISVTRYQ